MIGGRPTNNQSSQNCCALAIRLRQGPRWQQHTRLNTAPWRYGIARLPMSVAPVVCFRRCRMLGGAHARIGEYLANTRPAPACSCLPHFVLHRCPPRPRKQGVDYVCETHVFTNVTLVQADMLRVEPDPRMYKTLLLHIMAEHIGDSAPSEVNLSDRIRKEIQERVLAVHEALDKVSW